MKPGESASSVAASLRSSRWSPRARAVRSPRWQRTQKDAVPNAPVAEPAVVVEAAGDDDDWENWE